MPSDTTVDAKSDLAADIARKCGELSLLAGRARWPLLTYFLNMARIEAETQAAAQTGTYNEIPSMASHAAGTGRAKATRRR